jgi:hypothetical protein
MFYKTPHRIQLMQYYSAFTKYHTGCNLLVGILSYNIPRRRQFIWRECPERFYKADKSLSLASCQPGFLHVSTQKFLPEPQPTLLIFLQEPLPTLPKFLTDPSPTIQKFLRNSAYTTIPSRFFADTAKTLSRS